MKIDLFDGGLATRKSPHLIAINEGVEYENIDNSLGILAPVKAKTDANIPLQKYSYYYIAKSKWVSSTTYRDYLEYRETLYYTEGTSYPRKYDGGTEYQLGIEKPATAPVFNMVSSASPGPTDVTLTQITSTVGPGWNLSIGADDTGTAWGVSMTRHKLAEFPVTYIFVNEHLFTGLLSTPFTKTLVLTGTATDAAVQIDTLVNRVGKPHVYREREGDYHLVGTLTSTVTSIEDNVVDIYNNDKYEDDEAQKVNGTYQYVLTYYNSADGSESAPSPLTGEQTIGRGYVELIELASSADPQVDKKRLYRIGGTLTDFTLVAELARTTTTYIDKLSDTEIDGRILDSVHNSEAPVGLAYLVESYGIFFGAIGDSLYYSRKGYPNAWPEANYIDFEAVITGIGSVANGIIVFTRYKSWVITGTSTTTFVRYPLGGDQGCVSHQSIQQLKGSIIWMSTDGVCTTSGSEALVLSKDKLGKQSLEIENAVVYDEVYYAQQTNGKVLALDVRFGSVYKQFDLGVTRLAVANDILYGFSIDRLYSLFSASTNEVITFLSSRLTEGSYSNRKVYKGFYIRSEGTVTISVLLDKVVVSTQTFTTDDTHELKVPQSAKSGYTVQFQITGTGTVYEIEYKVLSRQNAR